MFISLDLETTGLNKRTDKIIEFGAIKFDLEGHVETFQTFINPNVPIPEFITHITNIKNEDVASAPKFSEVSDKIKEFIGDLPIIGHFISFDMDFMTENRLEFKNPLYDTSELTRIFMPSLPSYSLEILSGILNLTHEEKHRALDDSIAAQELFMKLIEIIGSLPKDLLEEIKSLSQKSEWDFGKVLGGIQPPFPGKSSREEYSSRLKNGFPGNLPGKSILPGSKKPSREDPLANYPIPKKSRTLILTPFQTFKRITSSNKIYNTKDYISTKRLEEFKQKSTLKTYELTALIKVLIWLKDSQTGLLEEINFTPDEKTIITRIRETEDSSPFKKETKEKLLIAEYGYQIDQPRPTGQSPQPNKFKKIIVTEPLKFLTFLQFHDGVSLWQKKAVEPIDVLLELEPKSTALQKIKSKLEMLFGIIREYMQEEIFEITNLDLASSNWQKLKDLVTSSISLSQDLKDIVNEKTSPYLKLWKEILRELSKIFIEPELEKYHMWIQLDRNYEPSIKKIPIRPVLPKHVEIMGGEDAELLKTILNSPDTKVIPEDSSNKNPPQIFIVEDFIQGIADFFVQFIRKEKGQNLIVMNSAMKLEQLLVMIAPKLKKEGLSLLSSRGSGMGKSLELYKLSPETSSLLITPNKFQLAEENFKNLIIQQLPFNPPSDQLLVALSKNFKDPFNELQVPLAIIALKNMIKNFNGSRVIILDNRIVEKNYSKAFLTALEKISKPLVVPAKTLIE